MQIRITKDIIITRGNHQKISGVLTILLMVLFTCTDSFGALPDGYVVTYSKNFETTQSAGAYMGNEAWYFYSNPSDNYSVRNNNDPELHKRFMISADPTDASNKTIRFIKFSTDKDYQNPNLNPRTELSLNPSNRRSASEHIYLHLRTFFPEASRNINVVAFIQFWLHAPSNTIPLQVMVNNGYFSCNDPSA